MRPVFSNIFHFLKTKSTFYLLYKFFGGFETPKKFENFNKKISLLLLKILSNDASKNSFQTVLTINGLVMW